VIILAPLAIAGTALAFSLLQTPIYQASATVLVDQQQGQGDSPARVDELQALIPSAVEIITTRPVAEEATLRLGLAMDPDAKSRPLEERYPGGYVWHHARLWPCVCDRGP